MSDHDALHPAVRRALGAYADETLVTELRQRLVLHGDLHSRAEAADLIDALRAALAALSAPPTDPALQQLIDMAEHALDEMEHDGSSWLDTRKVLALARRALESTSRDTTTLAAISAAETERTTWADFGQDVGAILDAALGDDR